MTLTFRKDWRQGVAFAAAAMLTFACGGGPAASNPGSQGTFTPDEVLKATGIHGVVPIYAVPKSLPKRLTLVFINPDLSVPTFKTWSQAMEDAAKFYGVTLKESDVHHKFEDEATAFQTMQAFKPDVVGTHPGNPALLAATKAAGIPLITVDAAVEGNPYSLGLPNEKAGTLAGDFIVKAVQQKLQNEWKGRHVIYVGMTYKPCDACDARVNSALVSIRKAMNIPDSDVVIQSGGTGSTDHPQQTMADIITAHPGDVFMIVGLNDQYAYGPVLALKAANKLQDGVAVGIGADDTGLTALRSSEFNKTFIGTVDANPYAEGWNWVEAAVAVANKDTFKPYDLNRLITPDNVNQTYPK